MSRVHKKTLEFCESAPGFLSWLMEENSDFEEIRADDGQSSNGAAIRQNVPSESSSTDKPPATSQTPLGRRASQDPTRNAALNLPRNNPARCNRGIRRSECGEVAMGGILKLYCSMVLPDSHGKSEESI
jgi:hypothetical protein